MNPIDLRGLTACFTSSLLTATGTETVHDSTVLLQFCINGKAYTKSGTNADQTTPITDAVTGSAFSTFAANQGTVVVWCYDSTGTVKCVMGKVQSLDAVTGQFLIAPEFPLIPDTLCPFAYQVLKADSTAGTIAFGTSNWDATGFTNVIQNVSTLPSRPQVA
jgi:hypothetical protein